MRTLIAALVLAAALVPAAARAQQYHVYDWETPVAGQLELELWNRFRGEHEGAPEQTQAEHTTPGEDAWIHTAEVEVGVTDRLVIAAYLDVSAPTDSTVVRGVRVEARYRLAQAHELFFDPALYLEYSIPFGRTATEELEGKVILQKQLEDFQLLLNPGFSKVTSGDEIGRGLEFTYAARLSYRRIEAVQPGIEIYGSIGAISAPDPLTREEHTVFGTIDFQFAHAFIWRLAAGVGLTRGSPGFVAQSWLVWEPSPSVPFHGAPH